jgi:hypothetical protein
MVFAVDCEDRRLVLWVGCLIVGPMVSDRFVTLQASDGTTTRVELPEEVLNQGTPTLGFSCTLAQFNPPGA